MHDATGVWFAPDGLTQQVMRHLALASSAKQDELHIHKRLAAIEDLVQASITSDNARKSKPHPNSFNAALDQLPAVAAADAIMVGITPYDAKAAAKTEMTTIGLLTSGFLETDFRQAGCIAIYQDAADPLKTYDRSSLTGRG